MTRTLALSAALAAALHLGALFGLRDHSPAKPLPMAPESVDVDLTTATEEPEPAAEIPTEPIPEPPPPEPVISPEPDPPPEPEPTPVLTSEPTPEPVAEVTKKPDPEPTPVVRPKSKPVVPKEKPQPTRKSPAITAGTSTGTDSKPTTGPTTSIRVRSNPAPVYPPAARQARQEGTVTVDVEVSPTGTPLSVGLTRSSGFPSLDQAALAAVRRWSFEPAKAAGVAIKGHVRVPVRFRLDR